jgi:hypothetical protein
VVTVSSKRNFGVKKMEQMAKLPRHNLTVPCWGAGPQGSQTPR